MTALLPFILVAIFGVVSGVTAVVVNVRAARRLRGVRP